MRLAIWIQRLLKFLAGQNRLAERSRGSAFRSRPFRQAELLEPRLALSASAVASTRALAVTLNAVKFDATSKATTNSSEFYYKGTASATGSVSFSTATLGTTGLTITSGSGTSSNNSNSSTSTFTISGNINGSVNNGTLSVTSGSKLNILFSGDTVPFSFNLTSQSGGTFNPSNFTTSIPFSYPLSDVRTVKGTISGNVTENTTTATDLAVTAKTLGTGSYEFNVGVTGKFMRPATMATVVTDAKLFWSRTNTLAGKLQEVPISNGNIYWNTGNLKINANALGVAPTGAKFLVFAADSGGKVAEANETNNVVAITLPAPAPVSLLGRNTTTGAWTLAYNNGNSTFTNSTPVTWATNVTWVDVFRMDVNGDGKEDLVGRNSATGVWQVSVNNGNKAFTNSTFTTWSSTATWANVFRADVNGDGKGDIIGRDSKTGNVVVALSVGTTATTSTWGSLPTSGNWVDIKPADMNGDGRTDLVARDSNTGNWNVLISDGTKFTGSVWKTWSTTIAWTNTMVGDVNGDGKADILSRNTATGNWFVAVSTGTTLGGSVNWLTSTLALTDVGLRDMNADGKADLVGRNGNTFYVGLSDGVKFNQTAWITWPSATYTNILYADFNGDGREDVAGLAGNVWYVSTSTGTTFNARTQWSTWVAAAAGNIQFARV